MSSTSIHDKVFLALAAGPFILAWGLKALAEKRELENIPSSKVRSAAMGFVELSGIARFRKQQRSPLSNKEVCWWNCRIQELRSTGKSSYWATIKQIGSVDLFYLDDTTGKVLINPFGAELHLLSQRFELNASTRTAIAPVLNSWGINDMNWFGFERRMRIIEDIIPDGAPLFVMGELISMDSHLGDRRMRLNGRLRAIKSDPAQLAKADTNHDGTVDADEWDAFRVQQEDLFLKEEAARRAAVPEEDRMLVKAPVQGTFIVSTQSEQDLVSNMSWLSPLAILGGILLSALAVWFAILSGWQPIFIIGSLAVGFVAAYISKQLGLSTSFNRGG